MAKPEDTVWTAVTGKYFDDAAKAHFFQIGGKVVILNGSDNLSYYNISTNVVVPFTTVSTPGAPTLSANNVGTGSVGTITYRVTCNSTVGETAASSALSTTVDTDRDLWKPPSAGGTDSIVITFPTAPANAVSWNVYMGTVTGFEYLIASSLPISSTTFTDDGSFAQDTTRLYPTTNSTAGPRATRGANISGRAFLVGDVDNPYYVWNGGDPGNELDFSPANGGGWSLVNNGGKELPQRVVLHRDGKGTALIKVYCSGTKGKRFSMTPDQLTIGDTVITFYDVTEDEGETGTNAPDALLYYNNSWYYPSSEGFETDGTLPQLQNVLTSRKVSNTIQPDMTNLNQSVMDGACGMVFDGRLLFALPVNADSNNEVWVLDLDRKGAWMKPWSIAADWMLATTDNSGNVHHLVLSNNTIYDLSYSSLTADDGAAVITNGQSGQIYFSDDKRMWAQLLQVIFVVLRPQGEINFQITGKTEDASVTGLGDPTNFTAGATSTVAGWGETNMKIVGWGRHRWSETSLVPTSDTEATQEIPIEVDEEVQWASYAWSSNKVGVDYAISDIIFEYIEVGIKDLQ